MIFLFSVSVTGVMPFFLTIKSVGFQMKLSCPRLSLFHTEMGARYEVWAEDVD